MLTEKTRGKDQARRASESSTLTLRRCQGIAALLLALMICGLTARTMRGAVCSVPTFANAQAFDAGGTPMSAPDSPGLSGAALGDFNGDSKLDLAVPLGTTDGSSDGDVSVLLGDGHGNFAAGLLSATGANPVFVAIGDFNGDGKSDLAVAFKGEYDPGTESYTNGGVSVLLGNGNGTFQPAKNYLAGPAIGVAVADFNGDGKADLVAVLGDSDSFDNANNILVLLGNSDGTFQDAASYLVGSPVSSVVVADFDRDGRPDLAVATASDDLAGLISVLLGKRYSGRT